MVADAVLLLPVNKAEARFRIHGSKSEKSLGQDLVCLLPGERKKSKPTFRSYVEQGMKTRDKANGWPR